MGHECNSADNTVINGKSIDIILKCGCSEIKADITVSEYKSVRLWGQIKNTKCEPVANVLLKLVKVTKHCNECKLKGIAHTVSDCNGFYQFDLCGEDPCACYKVLLGKAAVGPERVIVEDDCCCDHHEDCCCDHHEDCCEDRCYEDSCCCPPYTPCREFKSVTTSADHINCHSKNHQQHNGNKGGCHDQQCGNRSGNFGCRRPVLCSPLTRNRCN